ncbi:MAG TPA: metallophosphoesterase [Ramlibacter sp.]|nr:metallophosphoesterase [Ramlibacter sp.]
MKLNILSDLHLSQGELALPANDADLVVLAGDIDRPAQAVAWASRLGKPVLYVPGNHEFYGGSIEGSTAQLKRLAQGTAIRVLDDESQLVGNVRFLGSTLWTDFLLFGRGQARQAAMDAALRFMRDYSRIRLRDGSPDPFTPLDSAALFQRHAAWLAGELAKPHDGPTVVITHHAPSRSSIHPRFAQSLINACFVSDAQHLLDGKRVRLWIHGHTHDSFDYVLNGTRVVCNPRGYARGEVNENAAFDPDFMVEVS